MRIGRIALRSVAWVLLSVAAQGCGGSSQNGSPAQDTLGSDNPMAQAKMIADAHLAEVLSSECTAQENRDEVLEIPQSLPDRKQFLCEFSRALQRQYSGYPLKERLMPGFTFSGHLRTCLQRETDAPPTPVPGLAPIEYLERLVRCVADLKDGHFRLKFVPEVPRFFGPISMVMASGSRAVIRAVHQRELWALDYTVNGALDELVDWIKPGVEVLEIDGLPASQAIAATVPYQSASSEAAAMEFATESFFLRAFPVPRSAQYTLKLRKPNGRERVFTLPWMSEFQRARLRPEYRDYLRHLGIPHHLPNEVDVEEVRGESEQRTIHQTVRRPWTTGPVERISGTYFGRTLEESVPEREWVMAGSHGLESVMALNVFKAQTATRHRPLAYLELMTFDIPGPVSLKGARDSVRRPFFEVLGDIMAELKRIPQLGVVIDLRFNGGGQTRVAPRLASYFLPPSVHRLPGYGLRIRASVGLESMFRMWTSSFPDQGSLDGYLGFLFPSPQALTAHMISSDERRLREISEARSGRLFTSYMVPYTLDRTDLGEGGFGGKVVLLTGPGCMSTCDIFAGLLKGVSNIKLLGRPTHGAGLGAFENDFTTNPNTFVDLKRTLHSAIPNSVLYQPRAASFDHTHPVGVVENISEEEMARLMIENHPVGVDIPWTLEAADISPEQNGVRFREAVLQALE